MAEFPALAVDGRNWSTWRENLERTLNGFRIGKYLNKTMPNPYNARTHALAKCIFALTIHPSLLARIRHLKSVHEGFKTLQNLLEKESTSTTGRLYEIWNDNTKREAAHSPETANDRGDTSRRDDEVRNGLRGSNNHVPGSETHREYEGERRSQGRVEKGPRVGEKGRESRGRDDEWVAAALEPGNGATDQTTGGGLSRLTTSPPSLRVTNPILLFEQTAPTSRQPTRQRTQQELEEAAWRYLARRKREDGEGSWRGVEPRDRGSREAVDEDGEDDDVHHAQVKPQQPQTVGQTAVVDEATDTTDPHTNSAGPAVPVGMTKGPPNESNGGRDRERGRNIEEEDEKGGRASESAAPSSNNDGGDEDVCHAYIIPKPAPPSPNHVPPPPDESRPPPSVSLEGETSDESTTTLPDEKSSGEGRGMAMSHREAVGGDDEVEGSNDGRETSYRVEETPNEVDGSDDAASTLYGVDDKQSRRGGARDQATGDQEGQEAEETRTNEGEECRTSVQARSMTNVDGHGQYTPNEGNSPQEPPPPSPHHPEPPPVPTPTPPAPAPTPPTSPYPERPHVDVNHTKSNKTLARRHADAVHDPGGETTTPDSTLLSVRLEGESVKSKKSRRVNKPGGKGDEGDEGDVEESRSREAEDKARGQSDDEDGQRDGRTIDTGSPTSGTSHNSLQVETGALADNEAGQQCNGKPNISTNSPGPSMPFPYATRRPTHLANPPRHHGRLKTQPTNVSKPKRTEYAPRQTVTPTTSQSNRM
ncbi:hypothetical protein PAXINDRAFT_15548 [Paxillus involutus ATCC 200175]|uniref:Uncharacterized protein n=1 Tax=Paxillus involutus ATCC 200175 TaxID=664439 RepID=A0A0C9TUX1_PAXIN|nr:hypothetical protein PAXINDRAFT_15548 [Paxillus involutus ATCC 200175]